MSMSKMTQRKRKLGLGGSIITQRQYIYLLLLLIIISWYLHFYLLQEYFAEDSAPLIPSVAVMKYADICAIQKGELRYIDEWVDYHFALGFDTIFIYDNSDDFELEGWHSNKYPNGTESVEIVHWPGKIQQVSAYNDCLENVKRHHRANSTWIAFIDIDEFVVIKDTKKFPFIMDLLDFISTSTNQDVTVGGLALNWQLFGWNNQRYYEAKPVSLRFNQMIKHNHVKTIVRAELVEKMDVHNVMSYTKERVETVDANGDIVRSYVNERMPTNVAALNHFNTKSLEEHKLRCKRGRTDAKEVNASNYLPCRSEEEILASWAHEYQHTTFDNSTWTLLKERVPAYRKYTNVSSITSSVN